MPEPDTTVRPWFCGWHEDGTSHETTIDVYDEHRTALNRRHEGHHQNCDWCYPDHPSRDCGCDDCYENYSEDEYEEDNIMTREWMPGPHVGDNEQGEYIQPGRTVGVEYERGSYSGTPGWENRILPEVGIGTDHCGMEVRTPPAAGRAADRFTRHTLESLIDSNTSTGNDSGLHVHVHFPEGYHDQDARRTRWNPDTERYEYHYPDNERQVNTAMARFLALWTAVEHVAFRFCPSRRNSSWSRQVNRNRIDRQNMVAELLLNARTGNNPNWAQSRYSSVNAMQSGYRTIEFRGHSSTNEVEHVMAWVAFVQGVVELSQKVSYITIRRISDATSHQERARLLMQAGRRHKVWTDTAYAAIRRELGLSAARPARVARAA